MNSWFSTTFTRPTIAVVMTVTRGRDTPLKNPSSAHSATPSGAPSMRGHQYSSALRSHQRIEAEEAEQRAAVPAEQGEEGQGDRRSPEAHPGRVSGPPAPPAALVLRDEGLHRQADAADQHHEEEHQPEDRRHAGHGGGGDVPHEPRVGEVDHRLQAAVHHERQRERGDGAVVDARTAVGADASRRQRPLPARSGAFGRGDGFGHGTRLSAACGGGRRTSRAQRGTP